MIKFSEVSDLQGVKFPDFPLTLLVIVTTVLRYRAACDIKTVHFWLKYNGLAIVRKTTKLIEGGHHGLQDYRYICFTSMFFTVFTFFFQNPNSRDFLRFFAVFRTFSRTMTTSGRVPTKSCLNEPHQIQLTMICVERRKGRSTYWYLWSGSVTLPTSTLCSQHSLLLLILQTTTTHDVISSDKTYLLCSDVKLS